MKLPMQLVIAVIVAGTSAFATSQDLVISTGADPKDSTYSRMFDELNGACGARMKMALSSGSVENLERLAANQVSGGIVQTDILWLRSRTEKLDNIKTLAALHPEEVHVIADAAGLKPKGMNPFAAKIQARDVTDTADRKVGSWGGSFVTARVISELLGLKWEVVLYPSGGQALAALGKGDVELVVAVGGQPLPALASLGQDRRLVGFSPNDVARLKDVYVPATLNYTKMGAMGVSTVATEALLVVQNYRSKTARDTLLATRRCLATSLDDLREGLGKHPKWRAVDVSNKGKWTWYE